LQQLKKVTRLFTLIALGLMIVALGFAAKHGQFESPSHHGHFLSKSVKMEKLSPDLDASLHCPNPPADGLLHLEVLFFVAHHLALSPAVASPGNLFLPLLV
jgi:hypothetical protein